MTSAHPSVPLADAEIVARAIVDEGLSVGAFRWARIAGSVRRKRPLPHDLEIVAEEGDYFGGTSAFLASIGVTRGPPNKAGARAPWSGSYYKGVLTRGRLAGTQLDLFVVKPPQNCWGVTYFLRTGSGEWNTAVVQRLWRFGAKCHEGHIREYDGKTVGKILPCDTEEDFFRYAHLPFVPPEEREMTLSKTRALFTLPV